MAVTFSHLADAQRAATGLSSSADWSPAAFTPTAGTRLAVTFGTMTFGGSVDPSGSLGISDSQGMTWTPKIGAVGNASSWAIGQVGWISSAVPASTSTTITFTKGGVTTYNDFYSVETITGSDGTILGYSANGSAPTDGGYTATLGATPTTDDVVVFARFIDWDTGTLAMGVGWNVVTNRNDPSGGGIFGVGLNDALASSSISITDTASGAAPSGTKGIDFAYIIKGSGAGVVALYGARMCPSIALAPSTRLGSG